MDPFKSTTLALARFISTKLLAQRDFLLYWNQVRYIVLGTRSPAVNNFAAHNCSWNPNSRQSRRPETYCLGRGIFGSFGPHGKTTMGMSASGRKWIQSYVFLPSQVDAVSHMKVCSNQQHPDQPSCMSLLLLEEDLDHILLNFVKVVNEGRVNCFFFIRGLINVLTLNTVYRKGYTNI